MSAGKTKETELQKLKKKVKKGLQLLKQAPEQEEKVISKELKKEAKEEEKKKLKSSKYLLSKLIETETGIVSNIKKIRGEIERLKKSDEVDAESIIKKLKKTLPKLEEKLEDIKVKKEDLMLVRGGDEAKKILIAEIAGELYVKMGQKDNIENDIENLEKSLKKIEGDKKKQVETVLEKLIQKRDELIDEMSILDSRIEEAKTGKGIVRGEGKKVENIERDVLKAVKEIVREEERAIEKDEKLSDSFLLDKFDDLMSTLKDKYGDEEWFEEKLEIFKKYRGLTKSQITSFIHTYLKREREFFDLFDNYTESVKKYKEDDLKDKKKSDILDMVARRRLSGDFSSKDKSFLTKLLLTEKCDPELDILCKKKDEVCDVDTNLCIKKPEVIPFSKMYKGTLLIGNQKNLMDIFSRVKEYEKIEKEIVREYKPLELPKVEIHKTKLIDKEGNVVEVESIERTTYKIQTVYPELAAKQCINDYLSRPWISNYEMFETYINMEDGSIPDPIYIKDEQINFEGENYYKINDFFGLLNCNKYSLQRSQKGYVLSLFNNDGEEMKFKLVHKLKSGIFKAQDEALFSREKRWFSGEYSRFKLELENYLAASLDNPKINSYMRAIAVSNLTRGLEYFYEKFYKKIDVETKNKIEDMAKKIESGIRNKVDGDKVEDYLREISEILIFFNKYNLILNSVISVQNFQRKFLEGIFNLENVNEIELTEIFPSLKSAKISESNKKVISDKIDKEIERQMYSLARTIYVMDKPGSKVFSINDIIPTVSYKDVPSFDFSDDYFVDMSEEGEDLEEWEKVYYEKDGKVYVFDIRDLIFRASVFNDYTNKFTGEPIEKGYIDKLLKIYNVKKIAYYLDEDLDIVELDDEKVDKIMEEKMNADKLLDLMTKRLRVKKDTRVSLTKDEKSIQADLMKIFSPMTFDFGDLVHKMNVDNDEEDNSTEYDEITDEDDDMEDDETTDEPMEKDEETSEEDEPVEEETSEEDEPVEETSDEEPETSEEEEDETSDEELEEEEESIVIENDPESVEFENDVKSEIDDEEINEIKGSESTCKYCNKELEEGKMFKSIVKSTSEGGKVLNFCSLKCMEEETFRKEK